jgi:hypothetical protein
MWNWLRNGDLISKHGKSIKTGYGTTFVFLLRTGIRNIDGMSSFWPK